MKKTIRILSAVIVAVLVLTTVSIPLFAQGLDNFTEKNKFTDTTFTDVKADDWFYTNVAFVYVQGLMIGNSETTFNPTGNVKLSETVTVADRLHMIYTTGAEVSGTPAAGSDGKWYDQYVDYAKQNGILANDFADYEKAATRAEFAVILASALPAEELEAVNVVAPGAIPDVFGDEDYAEAVYMLYRAGILTGSDDKGTFNPTSNIKRSEVAAILSRMVNKELRKSVSMSTVTTKIYDGDKLALTRQIEYNIAGNPVKAVETYADGTTATVDITYTAEGLLTKMVETSAAGTTTAEYTYNADGKAVKMTIKSNTMDVAYDITYDEAGEIVSVHMAGTVDGKSVTEDYDCSNGANPLDGLSASLSAILG